MESCHVSRGVTRQSESQIRIIHILVVLEDSQGASGVSSVSNGLLLSNCLGEAQIRNWPVTLVEKSKYLLSFPCPITHMHTHTHAHTHTHTHTHSEDGSREVCDFFYFLKSPKLKASDFKLLVSFIFPRLKLMEVLKERDMFEPRSKAAKAVLPCSSSSSCGKVFKVEIPC